MNINERLKPNTDFILYAPNGLEESHLSVLNELYLPLTKLESVMTYIYLTKLADSMDPLTIRMHRIIMDDLNIPLNDFSHHLDVLEALGLVRTYVSNHEHDDLLIYELLLPLSASSFFEDPMLSLYLFQQIGEERYREKQMRFVYPELPSEITEVTKKFTEVFTSKLNDELRLPKMHFRKESVSVGANIVIEDFDFDVLFAHIKGTVIDKKFFDKATKQLIATLSVLFDLNAYDMKHVILEATTASSGINHRRLKQAARRYFQKEHRGKLPKMISETSTNELTREEMDYFTALDHLSPLDRIQNIRDNNATDEDLRLITDLITQTDLSKGVINILLEYVYQYLDGDLPYKYVMKVAESWQSLNLANAKEAYDESMRYVKRMKEKEQKSTFRKKDVPGEKRPGWLDSSTNTQETTAHQDTNSNIDELLNYFNQRGEQ